MKTIYKYQLAVTDQNIINIPQGSEILCVQIQGEAPCLWVLVDTEEKPEDVLIETFGTGHEIPTDMGIDRAYIGTYQIMGGAQIYHVFRRL